MRGIGLANGQRTFETHIWVLVVPTAQSLDAIDQQVDDPLLQLNPVAYHAEAWSQMPSTQ
ncbi:hypothetical protein [Bradyrhizobium sp. sBnM-33]|uniref:hypothetical protein n=1 Tax=Bradyrhizobium sp. sBnM-33 TaxID=2831780 RepID=UPI001BD1451A|nr:hypothetical protein [Bradyrhizobium sp. sBnM-33]WOH53242.1 hypothetical protein RX328_14815 [Bradyrhizobium sp. sBnM-33]